MTLTARSLKRLDGVHPDLVRVVERAAATTSQPFQVIEGVRSLARQRQLVNRGASKTLNSRHLSGHAVDLMAMIGTRVSWEVPLYYRIADAMKEAARDLGVPLEWGGDWASFFDGPHFQLPWSTYPKSANPARAAAPPDVSERAETRASRVLAIGDRGAAVRTLQDSLSRLGFALVQDGVFGPQTRRAVKAFQAFAGLAVDGIFGPVSARALRLALKRRVRPD
ncbi:endolysin [Roseibium aquae]|uniref:Endolysin n=1 Tax=Roseibium aquae TaxID=1323746 RepID=A0A916TLX0_9HYPH|nr:peptidoglycan-binding protein [Roseibium aquae]GGB55239.1 endolysin [Roseibium aquae]